MVPKITTFVSESINIIFDRVKFSHIKKLNDFLIITVCNVLTNCVSVYAYTGQLIQNDSKN